MICMYGVLYLRPQSKEYNPNARHDMLAVNSNKDVGRAILSREYGHFEVKSPTLRGQCMTQSLAVH